MVKSENSYYPFNPFGNFQPGRNDNAGDYRYSFNGKEQDNEIKGTGNSLDFGARIYDSRLGRWMSTDPLQQKYPDLSPYCFVGNMPTIAIDPDGRRIFITRGSESYVDFYLKENFGNTLLFKYGENNELKIRNRQYKAYLKNPNYSDAQKELLKGMREAIRDPHELQVTVSKDNHFEIEEEHNYWVKNSYGINELIKSNTAPTFLTLNNTEGGFKEQGSLPEQKRSQALIANDPANKQELHFNNPDGTMISTGKSASSVFIHEVLDEFLSGYAKPECNDSYNWNATTTSEEKTFYQNKALEIQGKHKRNDHDKK